MEPLLLATYVAVVIGLPLLAAVLLRLRSIPSAPLCPRCLGDTVWLRRAGWLTPALLRLRLQWRWCTGCEWQGLSRLRALPQAHAPEPEPDVITIELQRVHVDGRPFQVVLQCRREPEGWRGRLVFTADEQIWCESSEEFHGAAPVDILVQVITLSDPALQHRLRRVLSG